jgi:hypothetical protein
MDNAAFDHPGLELARILCDLADKIENMTFDGVKLYSAVTSIRDVNGNRIGEFKITGKRG